MRPASLLLAITLSLPAFAEAPKPPEQTLYVATADHIYVYTPGAAEPRLTIAEGLLNLTQLAIDPAGRRYAANFGSLQDYSGSSVTEYHRGQTAAALMRTSGIRSATGVAVDAFGDVYASSYYADAVNVYLPGQTTPLFSLGGFDAPDLLAVHGWSLFVGESGHAKILRFPDLGTLEIIAPGSLPAQALTYGGPFIVGDDGSVYASGFVIASDVGYEEFVDVFAPGTTRPSAGVVVSTGRRAETAPYVAVSGSHIYVTSADAGAVFEYDAAAGMKPVRTISSGLNQPGPLAVDAGGNLYVGSIGYVSIYAPAAVTPTEIVVIPGAGAPVSVLIAR